MALSFWIAAPLLNVIEGMADLTRTIGLNHGERLLYQRPNRRPLDA